MSYTSQNVTDELFVDGLQDATFQGGVEVSDIAAEFLVDERLRTLWDRDWVMYLLVGLLSVEWLTRKLLKLA